MNSRLNSKMLLKVSIYLMKYQTILKSVQMRGKVKQTRVKPELCIGKMLRMKFVEETLTRLHLGLLNSQNIKGPLFRTSDRSRLMLVSMYL